ncbi:MAG: hypothetical protein HKN14_15845, partial [Marinicaulis sp.]|nr:hypothetical protein [Marinicaulis sp.]
AQLFTRLADDGYEHLVIETSPAMASILDEALREDGLDGLRALYAQRGGEPAFFGMEEEAELLAAARATSNAKSPVLLGVDYEVASDPVLLRRLQEKRKPKAASAAMDTLVAASDAAWAKYFKTSGPQYIFSFSGDPELVRAVEAAWQKRDEEAAWILDTIEETLEINRRWVSGEGWQSNARRAALLRSNFLRHWRDHASRRGDGPKMMLKLGASHLVRGRNMVETFDLGALLPEIAAMADKRTVSLFVVPGPGSMTAVLNPTNWTYIEAPGKDSYAKDLGAVMDAAFDDGFTLIDLRALRPHMRPQLADAHVDLARIIHGFDYMLVLTGGTASGELDHFAPPRSVE